MRNLGTNVYSNSFEPLVNGALDARTKIEGPATDLLLKSTWLSTDGNVWSYPGMIVSVYNDPDDTKNGLYQLLKEDYTQLANWKFIGSDAGSLYELPTASSTIKGGIKVGAGLTMNGEVLSATGGGVADAVDWSNVLNKPNFATVATSGSYNDLSNKPTIPAAVTVDSVLSTTSTNPVLNKVINAALATKQATGDYATKSEIPTKLPNPNAITFTGGTTGTYDGSSAVTVNVPEGSTPSITLSFLNLYPILGNPSGATTDDIKTAFGEENLRKIFEEGNLDVIITDVFAVGDGSEIHTTRNMLAVYSQDPFIKMAGIELTGISENGLAEITISTDETQSQYGVEISDILSYDMTIDKNSHNGVANSAVAYALELIERKQQYIKTENLFSLNRTTNINLVANDVTSIKSLYYPLYLAYAGKIDGKSVRVPVTINNGTNGGNLPYLGEDFILSCVIDSVPINVVVSYSDSTTMTAKIPLAYNPENPNIKYLTTPKLFSASRNSNTILNAADLLLILSLFNNNFESTQLYYVGSPTGDSGIFPVTISGNQLQEPNPDNQDGMEIYLSTLLDVGFPVVERITTDYGNPNFYAIQLDAERPSGLYAINYSLSTNSGYIKFTNGLLFQWGLALTTGAASYTCSLPIAFLSTNYFVVATPRTSTPTDAVTYISTTNSTKTASSFGVAIHRYNGGSMGIVLLQFNYIAVGRWK